MFQNNVKRFLHQNKVHTKISYQHCILKHLFFEHIFFLLIFSLSLLIKSLISARTDWLISVITGLMKLLGYDGLHGKLRLHFVWACPRLTLNQIK